MIENNLTDQEIHLVSVMTRGSATPEAELASPKQLMEVNTFHS